jgi:predicted HicB family RNase H-like nuclease
MVHIRLPEQLHKKLRVKAAEADITIQEWVVDAIKAKLDSSNSDSRMNK